jgi:hypothetical protein
MLTDNRESILFVEVDAPTPCLSWAGARAPCNTNKQIVSSCRGQRFEKMVINRRVIPSRSVPEEQVMAVSFELSSVLDKAYEDKSLTEILAAPPSALAGLTERHDQTLSDVFGIQTVAELGRNKHFALAGALVALSGKI